MAQRNQVRGKHKEYFISRLLITMESFTFQKCKMLFLSYRSLFQRSFSQKTRINVHKSNKKYRSKTMLKICWSATEMGKSSHFFILLDIFCMKYDLSCSALTWFDWITKNSGTNYLWHTISICHCMATDWFLPLNLFDYG